MGKLMLYEGEVIVSEVFSPGEEQEFKTAMLRMKKLLHPESTYFEVENEEKEPGFPDTIEVGKTNRVTFVEYKVSDINGNIKFEQGQPLWYKRNTRLSVYILAYSVPDETYYAFLPNEVLSALADRVGRGQKDRIVNIKGGKVN